MDQESSESDGEDEEQNEVDKQVEQERQIDEELSESDGENEEQNIEEELAEGESQNNQASIDAAGGDEEEEDEEEEDVSDGGHVQKSSSEPALAPPPSKRSAIANMTLDEDMLDCGVCCLPLKPPIFQCDVGHVVCSSCRNKLATVGRCHVCLTYITGGYRRCHALEQLVKSIRVSCPNTIYGCAARAPYYDQQSHLRTCPHAPCHCPAEACGFLGSTAALLHHFVDTHKWPCITGVQNSEIRVTHLHDGFNVIAVDHDTREYLFLLRVVRSPFGRAISSLCIHPQAIADDSLPSPSKSVSCRLQLFYIRGVLQDSGMLSHLQDSNFKVACTDLSNGMPGLRDCFQFIVPNGVRPETEATVKVEVSFTIRSCMNKNALRHFLLTLFSCSIRFGNAKKPFQGSKPLRGAFFERLSQQEQELATSPNISVSFAAGVGFRKSRCICSSLALLSKLLGFLTPGTFAQNALFRIARLYLKLC